MGQRLEKRKMSAGESILGRLRGKITNLRVSEVARNLVIHSTFLLILLIAWGTFGILSPLNGRLFIALLLAGLLLFQAPSKREAIFRRNALLPYLSMAFPGFLLFLSTDRLYVLGLLIVFLWGFGRASAIWGRPALCAGPLRLLSYFAWALGFALETVPIVYNFFEVFSNEYTGLLGRILINAEITIGPSVSGLWVLLFAIVYLIGTAAFRIFAWRVLSAALIVVFGAWTAFLVIQSSSTVFPQEAGVLANSVRWLFPVLLMPLAGLSMLFPAKERIPSALFSSRSRVVGLVALAAFVPITLFQMQSWEILSPRRNRIMFWNKGYLDWDTAVLGKYGSYSGGMFGHLPAFLELDGFRVSKLDAERLKPEQLEETDIFAIINLGRRWEEGEIRAIWGFVERGGALLILGDHTNVFGLQDTYNELLDRINVRFEFDSAFPCRGGWSYCQSFARHPVLAGARSRDETGIDVGASLTIGPPAISIIWGPLSFSDGGNPYNVGGSLLGNYSYEHGEKLGDMCLLAAAFYGRGKVLVFGDTTSFQNGSVTSIYTPFLHNVFTWLSCETVYGRWYWLKPLAFLVWVILLTTTLGASGGSRLLALIFPFFLALSGPVSDVISKERMSGPAIAGPLAAIDYYHIPWASRGGDEGRGIGALYLNLERNAFIPVSLNCFDRKSISEAELLVILSPLKTIQCHEVDLITDYMAKGGQVILSVGYEEREGSQRLLEAIGLDIEGRSLGRAPNTYYKDKKPMDPEFMDAWPIIVREPAPSSKGDLAPGAVHRFFVSKGDLLATYREYGKGGMLFVSDSRFFTNRNVESMVAWHLGNITFIRNMLTRMKQLRGKG